MVVRGWSIKMKKRPLLIAGTIALASVTLVKAGDAPDLSAYGTPVETTGPVHPAAPSNEPMNRHWPANVCAEIQRVEKIVISGPLRPTDRGMAFSEASGLIKIAMAA
jgi:hypothetical protein